MGGGGGGHGLPSDTGRWVNIPYKGMLCTICDERRIGDMEHVFMCPANQDWPARKHMVIIGRRLMRKPSPGARLFIKDVLNTYREERQYNGKKRVKRGRQKDE